jgi:hypothetical protein
MQESKTPPPDAAAWVLSGHERIEGQLTKGIIFSRMDAQFDEGCSVAQDRSSSAYQYRSEYHGDNCAKEKVFI